MSAYGHKESAGPEGEPARGEHPTATVIGRSISFRMGSQILSSLINVAGMVVLGNYLAADGYGQYAFYYALVPLIASLSDLGVGVIITKEIARTPELGPRYLGDALLIKGAVALAMLLVVTVTVPLVLDGPHALLVWLVTVTALIDLTQDVGIWLFRAHDRQDLEALLLLLSQIAWVGGILLCVALKGDLTFALASATVAFLLRFAVGSLLVRRILYRPVYSPDWDRLKRLVAEGLPFGLAIFAVVVYGRAGVLLLKGLASNADVAYFNIGYMLSQPLGFISSAFSVSVFPSLARSARLGPESVQPVLRSAVKFQFLAALPLSVGLFLLSRRVVRLLLHGGSFQQAGGALMVLSLALTFIFLNLMSRYVLAALDQQRAYLRAIVAGLLVNVALGAALIHRFGYLGACVGLLGGEIAVLIMCQRTIGRLLPVAILFREAARPLAAALGMGGVVFLMRDANLALVTVVGGGVYISLLILLKVLSDEELRVMRGVYVSFRLPGSGWLTRTSNRP